MVKAWCDNASEESVGGKGFSLLRLESLGLRVPPAFIFPVSKHKASYLYEQYREQMREVFAGETNVLYSVRSGAPVSMPGMCDTFLNIGMTPKKRNRLAHTYGDSFVYFLQQTQPPGLSPEASVPDQIRWAMQRVLDSWDSKKAKAYRQHYGIEDTGTAVIVQKMVYGNTINDGATGVCFSHNLTTGKRGVNGEYLPKAQGSDIVEGEHNAVPISTKLPWFDELADGMLKIEAEWGQPVDVEFTIENGVLYFLQARAAKLTAQAKIEIAKTGPGLSALTLEDILASRLTKIEPTTTVPLQGTGISGGAVFAAVAHTPADAKQLIKDGTPFVYVRETTTPEDTPTMLKAAGLITQVGSPTAHAALIARNINIPCVMHVDISQIEGVKSLTMCGQTGRVFLSEVNISSPGLDPWVAMSIVKQLKKIGPLRVRLGEIGRELDLPKNIIPITPPDKYPAKVLADLFGETSSDAKDALKAIHDMATGDWAPADAIAHVAALTEHALGLSEAPPIMYIEQLIAPILAPNNEQATT